MSCHHVVAINAETLAIWGATAHYHNHRLCPAAIPRGLKRTHHRIDVEIGDFPQEPLRSAVNVVEIYETMSTPSPLLSDDNFRHGLTLDISILRALAARHRCNHGRTLYFRRIVMVLKCLEQKYDVMDALSRLQALQNDVNVLHQERQRTAHRSQKRRREAGPSQAPSSLEGPREEEEWSLYPTPAPAAAKGRYTLTSNTETRVVEELGQLMELWTAGIPEIVSRIHHASRALFLEVSRGFFLPFCSVALAALARIRSMLNIVGRLGLTHLVHGIQADVMMLKTAAGRPEWALTETEYANAMELFLEDGNGRQGRSSATATMALSGNDKPLKKPNVEMLLTSLGLPRSNKSIAFIAGSVDNESAVNRSQMSPIQLVENRVEEYAKATSVSYSEEHLEPQVDKLRNVEDVGKSIDFSEDTHKRHISDTFDTTKRVARSVFNPEAVDQNMALLDTFKSRMKQSTPSQKKKGKSQTVSTSTSYGAQMKEESKERRSGSTSPASADRPTKTKRKRKEQKANFFDELFD